MGHAASRAAGAVDELARTLYFQLLPYLHVIHSRVLIQPFLEGDYSTYHESTNMSLQPPSLAMRSKSGSGGSTKAVILVTTCDVLIQSTSYL